MSSDLFPTLGLPMYRGRGFNEDEDRPGAPLVFEGKPYTIVGVAAPAIQLPGAPDIYTLLGQETDPRMQNREIHPGIQVWGRLRPGVTPQQAGLELGLIGRRLEAQYPKSNAGRTSVARPLRPNVGDVGSTLWLLLGGVSLGKPLWIPDLGDGPFEIVGVVGHVRHWGLASDDQARVRIRNETITGACRDRGKRIPVLVLRAGESRS